MSIQFFSEDITSPKINKNNLKRLIQNIISDSKKSAGDISIIFTSDEYLLELNKKYLTRNTFTDIICFDYCDDQIISGDMFISIPRIKENALKYNVTIHNELHRVIIHGILHLLGHNDATESEKNKMHKLEDKWLNHLSEINSLSS